MAMSQKEFIDKLTKDVQDFAENQGNAFSRIFTQYMMKEAKFQMDRFYADYNPAVYVRTYNLMNHSYYPLSESEMKKGNTYRGGIHINSSQMFDYYSESRNPKTGMLNPIKPQNGSPVKDIVAYNSWSLGQHGSKTKFYTPKVTKQSPLDVLNDIKKDVAKMAFKKATVEASKQKYRLNYSFS